MTAPLACPTRVRRLVTAVLSLAIPSVVASCTTSAGDAAPAEQPPFDLPADAGTDRRQPTADACPVADSGCNSRPDAKAPLPPVLSTVHFVERADESHPSAVRFSWPGTEVRARFSGTGATLHLRDSGHDQLDVSIDGAPPTLIATTSGVDDYVLASGLPDAQHDVVITKRTEAFVGVVTFLGITSAENRPLVPTAAPAIARRIEIVGDSITCGYGVLGADEYCGFSPDTENEQLAYGALTAAALHAAHTSIAYSGIGVYRDDHGVTTDQMPVRYGRVLADEASLPWDFRYVADVVVVNLGTNDFAQGDPGTPFTTAYVSFLGQLRAKHPNAQIIAALSPMLSDGYPAGAQRRSTARTYIQAAVLARRDAGDTKTSFFELDEQRESDGYGCDYHPSRATHEKMSKKLTAALKTLMAW